MAFRLLAVARTRAASRLLVALFGMDRKAC
jgi:hypothetical protein